MGHAVPLISFDLLVMEGLAFGDGDSVIMNMDKIDYQADVVIIQGIICV
jgi:hypothetical protein